MVVQSRRWSSIWANSTNVSLGRTPCWGYSFLELIDQLILALEHVEMCTTRRGVNSSVIFYARCVNNDFHQSRTSALVTYVPHVHRCRIQLNFVLCAKSCRYQAHASDAHFTCGARSLRVRRRRSVCFDCILCLLHRLRLQIPWLSRRVG